MEQEVLELLNKIDNKLDNLEIKLNRIEKNLDAVYYQTSEFREELNVKLNELNDIKEVTKDNCYDITLLKIKAEKTNLRND